MHMLRLFFLLYVLICAGIATAQKTPQQPKLIIGIVVDQMRYDYLYKYSHHYGEGGIKRLLREGKSFENAHYNYAPTYTGPGHAAIYTGTSPMINGIIANDWFDRNTNKTVYVTQDDTAKTIGSDSKRGKMSPKQLESTTITDELKLYSHGKARVFGIALKDRGSILPAGHAANAAYWFDIESGNWITSNFYLSALPQWVVKFNQQKLPHQYLNQTWDLLLPKDKYIASTSDDQAHELPFKGQTKPVFPYNLKEIRKNYNFSLLNSTPFGNNFTTDFAIALMENEQLGNNKNGAIDFLALSYSSTDYIGHQFGPSSLEIEDTYLRFDKDLKRLFDYIDQNIGMENTLIFLTADHAAMYSIGYLEANKIPAGAFDEVSFKKDLNTYLEQKFQVNKAVDEVINIQVYLNRKVFEDKNIDLETVKNAVVQFGLNYKNTIQMALTNTDLIKHNYASHPILGKVQRGFNYQKSGDVVLVLKSEWFDSHHAAKGGTSHGSPCNYDTQVPVIFMGKGVENGRELSPAFITDIASTVSFYLGITSPSGNIGNPLPLSK